MVEEAASFLEKDSLRFYPRFGGSMGFLQRGFVGDIRPYQGHVGVVLGYFLRVRL